MSFNGSGVFNINTAGQPVVSGTVITATAFNLLTADLATGLSTCLTKDGQTNPTANLPMANYKFTGMGAGSDAADSANLSQVQSTVVKLIGSVSGADTITGSMTPALTAYAAGQMFYFVAASDNTGAVTLNINSLGAKSVTRYGTTALVAGDIKSGEVVAVVYDGTRFQLLNPNSFTSPNLITPILGTPTSGTLTNCTGLPLTTGITGTLGVVNGGTGQTTYTDGQLLIGNTTGNTLTKATLTAGTGVTITNGAGSITIAAVGLPTMNIVSGTTQTAVANNHYVLTNAATTTVTLPSTPSAGDTVYVTVANGLTTNVVARNGSNIQGLAEDLTLNAPYASAQLRFSNSTEGWVLT